jgi:predicted amidohydrolase
VEAAHLRHHALDLASAPLQAVLERLRPIRPTLVVGLIERHGGKDFNTAVVVQSGQVRDAYRKTHLTAGEALFEPGERYPVFEQHGIRYGIRG